MNRHVRASFLVISLYLIAALGARAQNVNDSATDYFNSGAQFYISNSIPEALKRVESGLKIYPEDVKLKKLEELLKQQQQQQQQNQQNQKNQKNQQQKNQQKQSKQDQSQNKPQNQQNQQQQQQQQQQNQQNQANGQKKEEQAQQPQAMAMTPEEAKRMLDAQKGNEQVLQFKPQNQPENANTPIKDW